MTLAGNTEQRLKSVEAAFHSTDGIIGRWHIDDDKHRAIHNLLIGTSPDSRKIITSHLNFFKWKESAFNADLLKSTRWLINATPKGAEGTVQEAFASDCHDPGEVSSQPCGLLCIGDPEMQTISEAQNAAQCEGMG